MRLNDGGARERSPLSLAKSHLPALKALVEAVQDRVGKQGFLLGMDGRKLRCRSKNAALNTVLQSAGALAMKKALVILDADLQAHGLIPGQHYEFVANVHDEWQIEVDEVHAEGVGQMAADAIFKAGEFFGFRCPLAGQFHVGLTWADTH